MVRFVLWCSMVLAAVVMWIAGTESQTLPPKASQSRVWISEFKTLGAPSAVAPIATLPSKAGQTLDISNGPQNTAPFNPDTGYVRVICEDQCGLSSSEAAPEANSLIMLPRMLPEYFGVPPGGTTIRVFQVP